MMRGHTSLGVGTGTWLPHYLGHTALISKLYKSGAHQVHAIMVPWACMALDPHHMLFEDASKPQTIDGLGLQPSGMFNPLQPYSSTYLGWITHGQPWH